VLFGCGVLGMVFGMLALAVVLFGLWHWLWCSACCFWCVVVALAAEGCVVSCGARCVAFGVWLWRWL